MGSTWMNAMLGIDLAISNGPSALANLLGQVTWASAHGARSSPGIIRAGLQPGVSLSGAGLNDAVAVILFKNR